MELLLARNPEPDSSLPWLLWVPVDGGLVFRVKDTWPRTTAVYCHPVPRSEWPAAPVDLQRVPLRVCERRGAAIDIVADRGREQRSQVVFTRARGRAMVFWQAPRTRKQARPGVRVPTARASGLEQVAIVVDSHERHPYTFAHQQATTSRRALACGDYAVELDGRVVAAVERKSLSDLLTSLTSGRLRFALTELAGLPRAAVVVEDRFSQVFAQDHVRPAVVADGLAELQVRFPTVPLLFLETRKLAEEWTYRYLAASLVHLNEHDDATRVVRAVDAAPADAPVDPAAAPDDVHRADPVAPTSVVRAWALAHGLPVADRGRLRPEILAAWRAAAEETPAEVTGRPTVDDVVSRARGRVTSTGAQVSRDAILAARDADRR